MQKFDPYINVDPDTMSPFQHGEVFVTEDGAETDLDIGHYPKRSKPHSVYIWICPRSIVFRLREANIEKPDDASRLRFLLNSWRRLRSPRRRSSWRRSGSRSIGRSYSKSMCALPGLLLLGRAAAGCDWPCQRQRDHADGKKQKYVKRTPIRCPLTLELNCFCMEDH